MKIVLNAVDDKECSPDLAFTPDPEIAVSGPDQIALMEEERRRSDSFTG